MEWQAKDTNSENTSYISQELQISPFLSTILCNRGINTPEKAFYFLYGDIENTLSPFLFKGMDKAVDYLRDIIQKKQPVFIMGDKDVDGMTGTAILYSFFKKAGIGDVFYDLPVADEGYGFSQRVFKNITNKPGLETVITVDCGIKENKFIDQLNAKNIPTIVTDHHVPSEKLPEAYAILNPHLNEALGYLSGAAVALKLIQGVYFSYNSFFYNKEVMFLTYEEQIIGMLSKNFVPELTELKFKDKDELAQYILENFEEMIIVSTPDTIQKIKDQSLANIKYIDIFDIGRQNLKLNHKEVNTKTLCEHLNIYYNSKKMYRTIFSLMKKIFFKYYLKIGDVLESVLKYATLGTVCDYMPLNDIENHIIVKTGLEYINKNIPDYIRFLVSEKEEVNMKDIGFSIGPVLNSSGRLGQPNVSFEFLIENEEVRLKDIFDRLKTLNDQRKKIGDYGYKEALTHIELNQKEDEVLFYSSSNIIQGVTGIIATKLSKEYQRPSFVFFIDKETEEIKGSARCFKDIDLLLIIDQCKDLFNRFGGHKKACGMSFELKYLEEVMETIKENSKKYMSEHTEDIFLYDMYLNPAQINGALIREIKNLYPFGPDNEEPVFFSNNLTPIDSRLMGKNNNHIRFKVKENPRIQFIGWKMAEKEELLKKAKVDIVYSLQENFYNNHVYLQGIIIDIRETL